MHRGRQSRPGLRSRVLQGLMAGLVISWGFPPHHLWWLAPFGVALHVRAVRGLQPVASLAPTAAMAFGCFAPMLAWLRPVGSDAWLALTALQIALTLPLGPLVARGCRSAHPSLAIAGSWLLTEALRSRAPFGGFPWGRLAFAQVDGPLLAWARWGGAPLVGALVALSGALLIQRRLVRSALPWIVGALLSVPTGGGAHTVQTAVVQGNVPRMGLDFNAQRRAVLDNHVNATLQLAADVAAGRRPRPDLVIWPENSSDLDPFEEADAAAQLTRAAQAIGQPILVGAVLDGPGPTHVSNTGLVWTPTGPDGQRYVKRDPVPFGEYLPFRSLLSTLITRFQRIGHDFISGDRPGLLTLNGVPVGDVICFEIARDGIVRDAVADPAQLLVVQTNNATFAAAESRQQLAMVRFRTVEHGRSAVMASTSGVSALVRPDGAVLAESGIFQQRVLESALPLRTGRTPVDVLGGWIELSLCVVGALALLGRREVREWRSGW